MDDKIKFKVFHNNDRFLPFFLQFNFGFFFASLFHLLISFQIKFQRVFVDWLIHWHSLSMTFATNQYIYYWSNQKSHEIYLLRGIFFSLLVISVFFLIELKFPFIHICSFNLLEFNCFYKSKTNKTNFEKKNKIKFLVFVMSISLVEYSSQNAYYDII